LPEDELVIGQNSVLAKDDESMVSRQGKEAKRTRDGTLSNCFASFVQHRVARFVVANPKPNEIPFAFESERR
jgi:hypothetical protein